MSGSAADNEALVRRLATALQQRDIAAAGAVLAEDAVYHFPGRSRLAGTYNGKAAIFGVFQQLGAVLGPIAVTTHDILADDEHGVELVQNAAERDGRPFEWRGIRVYHFRDGLISETFVTLEDPQAFDEFVA